jgi:hypothetical protein
MCVVTGAHGGYSTLARAGSEVPKCHGSAHHGDERRAADEGQVGEEEELKPERDEEEGLTELRDHG